MLIGYKSMRVKVVEHGLAEAWLLLFFTVITAFGEGMHLYSITSLEKMLMEQCLQFPIE